MVTLMVQGTLFKYSTMLVVVSSHCMLEKKNYIHTFPSLFLFLDI